MKQSLKVLGVLFLAAIYCFAIGVVTSTDVQPGFSDDTKSSHQQYFSDLGGKFFYHTPPSENPVNVYTNSPAQPDRNEYTELCAIIQVYEQFIQTRFSRYSIFSRGLLINLRKSDLIYPFHHFW